MTVCPMEGRGAVGGRELLPQYRNVRRGKAHLANIRLNEIIRVRMFYFD